MTTPATWTEEIFAEMSAKYVARMEEYGDDAPKFSSEVVKEIAEEYGLAANGFRLKLSKAGLYVKKEATSSSASKAEGGAAKTGGARTSKAAAQAELLTALSDAGIASDEIDSDIIEKLTGKAAMHLAGIIRKIAK